VALKRAQKREEGAEGIHGFYSVVSRNIKECSAARFRMIRILFSGPPTLWSQGLRP